MEEKLFVVIHYTYGDLCGDSYYGKTSKHLSEDLVLGTEDNVSKAVDILNKQNHSYWASQEPEDAYDVDWCDEDYFYYTEYNPVHITVDELLKKRSFN